MNGKRIVSLDSIRGIAALIVVIFHILISFVMFYKANYLNEFSNRLIKIFTLSPVQVSWAGIESVLLFFVLSGFVLSIPFFNNRVPVYKSYVIKRFCRIYIPYIVIMMFSVLLVTAFHQYKDIEGLSSIFNNRWDHSVTFTDILNYIFMINVGTANVNGVVWSLFHEMRISVVLPFFLLIMIRFKFVKAFIITVGINLIAYIGFSLIGKLSGNDYLSSVFYDLRMTAYYCVFFIFGAFLYKNMGKFEFIKTKSSIFKLGLFILSIVLISPRWLLVPLNLDIWFIKDTISVLGILLLFIVVLNSQFADDLLTKKPLLWLGKISYSLYLVHIPVLMMCVIFLSKVMPVEIAFLFVIPLSLIVGSIFYRIAEEPAIRIGRELSGKKKKKEIITTT